MSSPLPIFGSQNLTDDDAQVIDSFFIETDTPPPLKDAIETIPTPALFVPPVPTRLLTGYQVLTTAFTDPFMLLATDLNRQQFKLIVTSLAAVPTLEDYVLVADEKSKCNTGTTSSGTSQRVRTGRELTLDVHTGAIWIMPNPAINSPGIEVSWTSTTK